MMEALIKTVSPHIYMSLITDFFPSSWQNIQTNGHIDDEGGL